MLRRQEMGEIDQPAAICQTQGQELCLFVVEGGKAAQMCCQCWQVVFAMDSGQMQAGGKRDDEFADGVADSFACSFGQCGVDQQGPTSRCALPSMSGPHQLASESWTSFCARMTS